MIKIPFKYKDCFPLPERELTEEELQTVTSKVSDGSNMEIIYYQGDEPEINSEPEEQKGMDISSVDINTLTQDQLNTLANLLRSKL